MNTIVIRPVPLTQDVFSPFGQVIETIGKSFDLINAGNTQKFTDLFKLDVSSENGTAQISLYRSKPRQLPFTIESLERHPLGSQAFIPLHQRPFPIIVAPGGANPEAGNISAFISNGHQGVNLARNTWHHYQVTLGEAGEYIVIDRQGPGKNLEERRLRQAVSLGV